MAGYCRRVLRRTVMIARVHTAVRRGHDEVEVLFERNEALRRIAVRHRRFVLGDDARQFLEQLF